jgi:hypothetical protein
VHAHSEDCITLRVEFYSHQFHVAAFLDLLVDLQIKVVVELVGERQVSPNVLSLIDDLAEVEVERLTHWLSEGEVFKLLFLLFLLRRLFSQ